MKNLLRLVLVAVLFLLVHGGLKPFRDLKREESKSAGSFRPITDEEARESPFAEEEVASAHP